MQAARAKMRFLNIYPFLRILPSYFTGDFKQEIAGGNYFHAHGITHRQFIFILLFSWVNFSQTKQPVVKDEKSSSLNLMRNTVTL